MSDPILEFCGSDSPQSVPKRTRVCLECGREFPVYARHAKDHGFCKPACRAKWHRDHPGQRRLEFLPTADRQAKKRLGRREAMLARLRAGSVRTWELMSLGGSGFSGRLHEIREQIRREGLTVRCIEDEEGATYRLEVLGG